LGRLNFPQSILAWDVIVLNGYLLLNMHIPGYLLYMLYKGEEPQKRYYLPFVMISIIWAISIHTVTAFLYSGLGGRKLFSQNPSGQGCGESQPSGCEYLHDGNFPVSAEPLPKFWQQPF